MKEILERLGLSEGEAKAYIALLKIGSSTTGPIAKEANLSRSKLYEILEKLAKKGLVSYYVRNNVQQFTAAEPHRVIDYLEKQEEQLKQDKKEFEKKIPQFESIIGMHSDPKTSEVYEGIAGIKTVREEGLRKMEEGSTMYYFGNPASGHDTMLGYWDDFNSRRRKKKITAKIIYNQDAKEFGKRRAKEAFTEVKYLPEEGESHAWIEIYGDILVIAMRHKTPMSVVIRNPLVAESFKTYFKNLWRFAET